jgi:hypothetical protein
MKLIFQLERLLIQYKYYLPTKLNSEVKNLQRYTFSSPLNKIDR